MDKGKGKPSLAYITQVLRDMGIREREVQALLDKKISSKIIKFNFFNVFII